MISSHKTALTRWQIRYAVLHRFGDRYFTRDLFGLEAGDALVISNGVMDALAWYLPAESTDHTIRAQLQSGEKIEFDGTAMPRPGQLRMH